MTNSDDQTVFGNGFLLQNPIEILTIPIPKGEKEARLGNITISTSKMPYLDQKGQRQYIEELPDSEYDRKIFNHIIKLVRNNHKSRIFEFSDTEELKANSTTSHTDSIRLYEPLKLSILRWYCVTLSIPQYLYIVKETKEFKKIPLKLIRVISGIQLTPNAIQFDIAESFAKYVKDQDFLHRMSPAAPKQELSTKTPVPPAATINPTPQQHHEIKETISKPSDLLKKKSNDAIDYINLFKFLNKWIQQKKIKISIDKLIERLGLSKSRYQNQPTRFLSDLNQACKKISQKTYLHVLIEAEKKFIQERQKEEYTYVKFELTVKDENLETYRNQVKRELGTGMYKFFAKSVNTLISEANLMNNKPDKLVYLMEYAYLNRKETGKPNTPGGSIENPIDYVHRELHKED